MTESDEQKRLMRWIRDNMPMVWEVTIHHEAERNRRGKTIGHFHAMGGKAGYPDIVIDHPSNGFHGLRIELKRAKGGRLSQPQRKWLERLSERGYKAVVCHGANEAIAVIKEYIDD